MKKILFILLFLVPTVLFAETTLVGVELIKKFEGLRLRAYKCPAGVWTIGYGHTVSAKQGMVITKQQAVNYLQYDLRRFEKYVSNSVPRKLAWNEFDALVSFSYNLGYRIKDGLRSAIALDNTQLVIAKIRLYSKARVGGKLTELRGLVRRRIDESNLYAGRYNDLDFFNAERIPLEVLRTLIWDNKE